MTTCAPCVTCGLGFHASRACSHTLDAVCTENGVCGTGEFILVEATNVTDVGCRPCSVCGVGTATITECTVALGGDTACQDCTPGVDFSTMQGASACTPASPCGPGWVVNATATASADTVCVPCPAGTTGSPITSFSTSCHTCSPGSYSALGSINCTACAAGTADLDHDASTPCEVCPVGQFQSNQSHTNCTVWTPCDVGEEQLLRPSEYFDRECRPCELNATFKADRGDENCFRVTQCAPGEIESVAPTLSTDRVCVTTTTSPVDDGKDGDARGSEGKIDAPNGSSSGLVIGLAVCGSIIVLLAIVVALILRYGPHRCAPPHSLPASTLHFPTLNRTAQVPYLYTFQRQRCSPFAFDILNDTPSLLLVQEKEQDDHGVCSLGGG